MKIVMLVLMSEAIFFLDSFSVIFVEFTVFLDFLVELSERSWLFSSKVRYTLSCPESLDCCNYDYFIWDIWDLRFDLNESLVILA
jgi:hypothetical protein